MLIWYRDSVGNTVEADSSVFLNPDTLIVVSWGVWTVEV